MMDLRAKLKRRRLGEDDRITIKHRRERCRCQGCNLNGEFNAVDTTPMGHAARTPMSSMGSGGGCVTLDLHLRMVFWPHRF
jgi:hypothetical protein